MIAVIRITLAVTAIGAAVIALAWRAIDRGSDLR